MTAIHWVVFLIICNSLTSFCFWVYIYTHDKKHKEMDAEIKHPLYDKILELECQLFDENKRH